MYILSYMVGSVLGIVIPMVAILLWPDKILGFLGQAINICVDFIQGWE